MEIYAQDKERVWAALKEGWQCIRMLQGEPTVDILRYETTGSDDVKVLEGEQILVPGLSGLEAAVFPRSKKRKFVKGLVEYAESDMTFVIYDVEALLTDIIVWQGAEYQVIDVNYNASSGRCVVNGSKIK